MSAYLKCPACGRDVFASEIDGCASCQGMNGRHAHPGCAGTIGPMWMEDTAERCACGAALFVKVTVGRQAFAAMVAS